MPPRPIEDPESIARESAIEQVLHVELAQMNGLMRARFVRTLSAMLALRPETPLRRADFESSLADPDEKLASNAISMRLAGLLAAAPEGLIVKEGERRGTLYRVGRKRALALFNDEAMHGVLPEVLATLRRRVEGLQLPFTFTVMGRQLTLSESVLPPTSPLMRPSQEESPATPAEKESPPKKPSRRRLREERLGDLEDREAHGLNDDRGTSAHRGRGPYGKPRAEMVAAGRSGEIPDYLLLPSHLQPHRRPASVERPPTPVYRIAPAALKQFPGLKGEALVVTSDGEGGMVEVARCSQNHPERPYGASRFRIEKGSLIPWED